MKLISKELFAQKIAITFRKLFITKTDGANLMESKKNEALVEAKAYTDVKKQEVLDAIIANIDSAGTNNNAVINGLDSRANYLEGLATTNTAAIAQLANLATHLGSFTTYSALSATDKDQADQPISVGDFAELSIRDGDKAPGLYRYKSSGWATIPYINYETANQIDEPISQEQMDAACGV